MQSWRADELYKQALQARYGEESKVTTDALSF